MTYLRIFPCQWSSSLCLFDPNSSNHVKSYRTAATLSAWVTTVPTAGSLLKRQSTTLGSCIMSTHCVNAPRQIPRPPTLLTHARPLGLPLALATHPCHVRLKGKRSGAHHLPLPARWRKLPMSHRSSFPISAERSASTPPPQAAADAMCCCHRGHLPDDSQLRPQNPTAASSPCTESPFTTSSARSSPWAAASGYHPGQWERRWESHRHPAPPRPINLLPPPLLHLTTGEPLRLLCTATDQMFRWAFPPQLLKMEFSSQASSPPCAIGTRVHFLFSCSKFGLPAPSLSGPARCGLRGIVVHVSFGEYTESNFHSLNCQIPMKFSWTLKFDKDFIVRQFKCIPVEWNYKMD
jgi:hypothetical protein